MVQNATKMTTAKLNSEYWNNRYIQNQTGWDIGYANPIHIDYVLENINKSARILIPGAGSGHELSTLWNMGYTNVFAIDLSITAKKRFLETNPTFPDDHYIIGDFFELDEKFDLILEQTFFCAIDPKLRSQYVQKVHNILNTNGKLFGVLFAINFHDGPPFGGDSEEYNALFSSQFSIQKLEKSYKSITPRQDKELIIEIMKK